MIYVYIYAYLFMALVIYGYALGGGEGKAWSSIKGLLWPIYLPLILGRQWFYLLVKGM